MNSKLWERGNETVAYQKDDMVQRYTARAIQHILKLGIGFTIPTRPHKSTKASFIWVSHGLVESDQTQNKALQAKQRLLVLSFLVTPHST